MAKYRTHVHFQPCLLRAGKSHFLYSSWAGICQVCLLVVKRTQRLQGRSTYAHCKENPIFIFLSWELRGLSTNFHIHVSVSDLYIPRIGPHYFPAAVGQYSYPADYSKFTGGGIRE
jgi:hypothetical protein